MCRVINSERNGWHPVGHCAIPVSAPEHGYLVMFITNDIVDIFLRKLRYICSQRNQDVSLAKMLF